MSEPLITVGLPVYNGQRYLREAIDSLLAQTCTDFELLISDNASTDSTSEICREYAAKDVRIRYIRQEQNLGAVANFQYVLDHARGRFFTWASDDDLWDEAWLEKLSDAMLDQPGVAAFGKVYPIDQDGQRRKYFGRRHAPEFRGSRLKRRLAFFMEFEAAGKANRIYSLFHRDTVAGLDVDRGRADHYILFHLLSQVEYVTVEGVHIYKRLHGQNASIVELQKSDSALLDLLLLKPLWRNISVACGYLHFASGGERLLLALLLPLKVLNAIRFKLLVRPA